MPRPTRPPPPRLDPETLCYAADHLADRLQAVDTFGAGGCPNCHDAELRGAIAKLRELAGVKKPVR